MGVVLRGLAIAGVAGICALALRHGLSIGTTLAYADTLAVRSGLGINQVAVTGSHNTLSDDIFAALAADRAGSILGYDTAGAIHRLQALPWVQSAQIIRELPDGLEVSIRERQPVAVWQHKQLMFLIDADGRTLEPTSRAEHSELPLVVGDEADTAARDLMALLRKFPAIAARLEAAIRVGGRRWNVQLKGAPTLLLPEDAPADALAWITRMNAEERLLDRRLKAIDLRVAGRVAFEVIPDAVAGRPGALRHTINRGA